MMGIMLERCDESMGELTGFPQPKHDEAMRGIEGELIGIGVWSIGVARAIERGWVRRLKLTGRVGDENSRAGEGQALSRGDGMQGGERLESLETDGCGDEIGCRGTVTSREEVRE